MTKQEVISGLKCHAGENGCAECPYDDMFAMHGLTCVQHLIIDAIDLLEEQESGVEPKFSRQEDGFMWCYCGKCGYMIERGYQNYCSVCGTKIKRKKEND